jgi:hypothetical protein
MGERKQAQHGVVILTALDLEYNAVRSQLSGIEVRTHHAGTRFEVGYALRAAPLPSAWLAQGISQPPSSPSEPSPSSPRRQCCLSEWPERSRPTCPLAT